MVKKNLHIRNVDENTINQFKIKVLEENKSSNLGEAIEEAMQDWIKKVQKNQERRSQKSRK